MHHERLGSRWFLLTFDGTNSPFPQPTTVCLVEGRQQIYLCDTHTGPISMRQVAHLIEELWGAQQSLTIINTHSDWDHVWGNCHFSEAPIVAHRLCHERMADDSRWNRQLKDWNEARNGLVKRRLPTVLIYDRFVFEEDDLTVFHTPGHSLDSISVWDSKDRIVFVGDNLEHPLPHIQDDCLRSYIETIDAYSELDPRHILSSHSGEVDRQLMHTTRRYLEELAGTPTSNAISSLMTSLSPEDASTALAIHRSNLSFLNGA